MSLTSTHPFYDKYSLDWKMMRDTYAGERVVKQEGTTYLPATPGQILDGMNSTTAIGFVAYQAYKLRAVFHDFVSDAVESYIGLLHQKPAVIELPPAMKNMMDNATINGEGLQNLLRRINEQQLVAGRVGLLADLPLVPDPANPLPYIASYITEAIRNWDDSADQQGRNVLNLVVLDESSPSRNTDFVWKTIQRYRVCELALPPGYVPDPNKTPEENQAVLESLPRIYRTGVFDVTGGHAQFNEAQMIVPELRGQSLEEIPFVMINTKDVVPTPDNPPLIGLARLALAVYRGEADYRQSLFLQSQDTLVIVGGAIKNATDDETIRVGAGARIDVDVNGDAKYIGVNSKGLPEQRLSLENDRKRAESKSGQLTAPTGQVESDKTLKTRIAAQTATLNQIAWSGAKGLEYILQIIARWMGADPNAVKITPNLDFSDWLAEGKSFDDLINGRAKGVPLSLESIHNLLVDRGLTQMTFAEEVAKIAAENTQRSKDMASLGLDFNGQPIAATVPEVRIN